MPYDFPDEVEEVIGKRAIIKLKKNKYNMDHPRSSISVMQFMMCDDLLGDFDQVVSGGDDDDDLAPGRVIKVIPYCSKIRLDLPEVYVVLYN